MVIQQTKKELLQTNELLSKEAFNTLAKQLIKARDDYQQNKAATPAARSTYERNSSFSWGGTTKKSLDGIPCYNDSSIQLNEQKRTLTTWMDYPLLPLLVFSLKDKQFTLAFKRKQKSIIEVRQGVEEEKLLKQDNDLLFATSYHRLCYKTGLDEHLTMITANDKPLLIGQDLVILELSRMQNYKKLFFSVLLNEKEWTEGELAEELANVFKNKLVEYLNNYKSALLAKNNEDNRVIQLNAYSSGVTGYTTSLVYTNYPFSAYKESELKRIINHWYHRGLLDNYDKTVVDSVKDLFIDKKEFIESFILKERHLFKNSSNYSMRPLLEQFTIKELEELIILFNQKGHWSLIESLINERRDNDFIKEFIKQLFGRQFEEQRYLTTKELFLDQKDLVAGLFEAGLFTPKFYSSIKQALEPNKQQELRVDCSEWFAVTTAFINKKESVQSFWDYTSLIINDTIGSRYYYTYDSNELPNKLLFDSGLFVQLGFILTDYKSTLLNKTEYTMSYDKKELLSAFCTLVEELQYNNAIIVEDSIKPELQLFIGHTKQWIELLKQKTPHAIVSQQPFLANQGVDELEETVTVLETLFNQKNN